MAYIPSSRTYKGNIEDEDTPITDPDLDDIYVNKTGDTMSGPLLMGVNRIRTTYIPLLDNDVVNKLYCDQNTLNKVDKTGDTMTGNLDMKDNKITTTYTPIDSADLTNKEYVDSTKNDMSNVAMLDMDKKGLDDVWKTGRSSINFGYEDFTERKRGDQSFYRKDLTNEHLVIIKRGLYHIIAGAQFGNMGGNNRSVSIVATPTVEYISNIYVRNDESPTLSGYYFKTDDTEQQIWITITGGDLDFRNERITITRLGDL